MVLDELAVPIVQAPMAGGPSTPELARAVSAAGGLGFIAAGYLGAERVREDINSFREKTVMAFGVNLFVPDRDEVAPETIQDYAARLEAEASLYGAALGEPRYSDDDWDAKLALLEEERPAVASFTFGCPEASVVRSLQGLRIEVWVTVTSVEEARQAQRAGVDVLVVQGAEAGGHQASFSDSPREPLSLLVLLRLVARESSVPLVATGGLGDGPAIAAALVAGARAVQLGTAFMLTPEAATHPAHRRAIATGTPTGLTRAFTGRQARGILNRFQVAYTAVAPSAYPHVNHLTSPLRAAAREMDDGDGFNLWAGEAHALARVEPAGQVVRNLWAEAHLALDAAEELAGRRTDGEDHLTGSGGT